MTLRKQGDKWEYGKMQPSMFYSSEGMMQATLWNIYRDLYLYYKLYKPTYKEVALIFDVSKERAQQLIARGQRILTKDPHPPKFGPGYRKPHPIHYKHIMAWATLTGLEKIGVTYGRYGSVRRFPKEDIYK